jgi:hypothetical protein
MVGSALHAQPWQDPSPRSITSTKEGGEAMRWDAERGHFLPGPNTHGEADQLELGRRVALELHTSPAWPRTRSTSPEPQGGDT